MKYVFFRKFDVAFFTYIPHASICTIPMGNQCYKGFQHIPDLTSKMPQKKII